MLSFLHAPSLAPRADTIWPMPSAPAIPAPTMPPALRRRQRELLPRFTALLYTELQAMPRRVRRALQRQWRLPLAGVALALALGQTPGQAATISVSAACRLADAITAANTDTATGGCAAGSGAATIVLPPGSSQTLTEVHNSTYGPTGLPVISSQITLEGQGSTIVRTREAPEFRILAVNELGDLTLQETTVSGGSAPFDASFFADPFSDNLASGGGGVANFRGSLTLTNSIMADNYAYYGYFCPTPANVKSATQGVVHHRPAVYA